MSDLRGRRVLLPARAPREDIRGAENSSSWLSREAAVRALVSPAIFLPMSRSSPARMFCIPRLPRIELFLCAFPRAIASLPAGALSPGRTAALATTLARRTAVRLLAAAASGLLAAALFLVHGRVGPPGGFLARD